MSRDTAGRHVRSRAMALLAMVGFVAAACNPVFGTPSGPVRHATLTSSSGGSYTYGGNGTKIAVTQKVPVDDDSIREVFWYPDTPYRSNQQACITWDTLAFGQPGGLVQPGLAMRISPTGPDNKSIRAVTVTENIWAAGVWILNVHTWDSSVEANPFTKVAGFDISGIVTTQTRLVGAPWYVCARTEANRFTVKVWTARDPEPSWQDPTHVFTTTLPPGWNQSGYSGGYIGHLRKGQSAVLSGLSSTPLCEVPEMAGTPTCRPITPANT